MSGRYCSRACYWKSEDLAKRVGAAIRSRKSAKQEAIEKLKAEHDLLDSDEVAERCGVSRVLVTAYYTDRGLLKGTKHVLGDAPVLLYERSEVERFVKEWVRNGDGRRRLWLEDPSMYVAHMKATGKLSALAASKGLTDDEAEAILRDRAEKRGVRLRRHRRGRRPAAGPAPHHLEWAELYALLERELREEYEERHELGLLSEGEKPPSNYDIALAVAETDFAQSPERWAGYASSPSDPQALAPTLAPSARDRVWKAVKPLLFAQKEIS